MRFTRILVAAAVMVVCAASAFAQVALTGTVKDSSGAVLPGVTVEAASPVLIEKVRSAISDGNGQYRITELPPGTYTVTFSLTGFSALKREGVELTGAGVTTINADLRLSGIEETITVSGETPVVDVQSTRRQEVIDNDTLKSIPATRGYNALVFLVPSITGSSNQIDLLPSMRIFYSHGGRGNEGRTFVDGMSTGSAFNGGGVSGYVIDTTNANEMQMSLSGGLAEIEVGGATVNFVPKTGGNTFAGTAFVSEAGQWSQGNNLDDRLRGFGIKDAPALYKNWDVSGSVGGPLVKDRLWFFANYRDFGSHDAILGMYANLNAGDPNSWKYAPDTNTPARSAVATTPMSVRLTHQITPRNKITGFYDYQKQCNGSGMTTDSGGCRARGANWIANGTPTMSPEASSGSQGTSSSGAFGYADTYQSFWSVTYTAPVTSRLLLEAGAGSYMSKWGWMQPPGAVTNLIQNQEQNSQTFGAVTMPANMIYRALDWNFNNMQNPTTWRASVSYVTGSHSLKVGYQGALNRTDNLNHYNPARLNYRTLNGAFNQFTMNYGEFLILDRSAYNAFFAQDQWTIGRLTLQGGVRYDNAWSWSPDGQGVTTADRFHPGGGITFPRTDGVTGFNDISPRFGAAYDVGGKGRTSVKVNIGRYLQSANNQDRYTLMNPAGATRFARTTNRAWTDTNGNSVPDCDLMNPAAQSPATTGSADVCGAWATPTFGQPLPPASINPGLLSGWGVRPSDWQFGASVQQQVLPRVGVEVGYYRRWFQGFVVTDNLASAASDYDKFTFTAPLNSFLPGGGGYTVTSLNPNQKAFSTVNNYTTFASDYGNMYQYWHGVDVNATARIRNGLTVQGGTSTGRGVRDNCEITAKLPELLNSGGPPPSWQPIDSCHVDEPWLTQIRALASYVVPKIDVQLSAGIQFKPGTFGIDGNASATNGGSATAIYNVPTAVAQQTLGRPLTGGAANTPVNLLEPGALYGDYIRQLDVRVGKILRFGRTKTSIGVDLYNLTNSNAGLTYNQQFGVDGSTYMRPLTVLYPRFVRFNATVDF
jgi:carboxypeptidase family protein